MDEFIQLVGFAAGASVVAWLGARFTRAEVPLGWPLGRESREAFWRNAMPWPRGVQEDSEISWHVPRRSTTGASAAVPRGPMDGRPVPPTRPQPRIRGR